MKNKKIINVLIGILFLSVFPLISATCNTYDDFSSDVLDTNKWEEVIATDMGTGMVDECYVENGVYHTAQTNIGDGGIGLVFKDIAFKSGDVIEYDVNYISGSGNRISTMILNGDAYSTAFLGFWNSLADGGGNNDYGIHHVKLIFLGLEGVKVELTRPNGYKTTWMNTNSKWGVYPSEEYTFGIVTRTGHNGLVHMDYDNVIICTDEPEPSECVIPTDGMIITEDTTFCQGEYELPNGLSIGANNIVLDCNGAVLNGNGFGKGINLFLKTNVEIKNCFISNFEYGIYIVAINNTIINNTLCSNLRRGIRLEGSRFNLVENNNISYSRKGIQLTHGSNFNIITNNIISRNLNSGIEIVRAHNNTINKNFIYSNNGIGVLLWMSNYNQINQNKIIWNSKGIQILSDSYSNIFNYNYIDMNYWYGFVNWANDITAEYNWWGTTNKSEIESKIYDYYDDLRYGKVDFIPFLCEPYPTNFISNGNGECIPDEDNDGIPNDEDKCSNTKGKQIVYGCSCEQILDLKPGKDKNAPCSPGIIKVFTKKVGWAKDLFQ